MTVDDYLEKYGLVPTDDALPAIRELLKKEADAERQGRSRTEDLALLCCVQLFSKAQASDILLIWEAKSSGFDLGLYLDVQLLCGPGLARAKAFLAECDSEPARKALTYIQECEAAGDFDGFVPKDYLDDWFRYFRVQSPLSGESPS